MIIEPLKTLYKFVLHIWYVASFRNLGPQRPNFALLDNLPCKNRGGIDKIFEFSQYWEQSSTLSLPF